MSCFTRFAGRLVCALLLALSLLPALALPALAAPGPARRETVVIGNDYGGAIQARVEEIDRYEAEGARVEIRGHVCNSSCTMFLGMKEVCILPETVFGFHGPARLFLRLPLPPKEQAHSAKVMAAHYPAPIRGWFLRVAQWRRIGFYEIKGADLIRLGVRACATAREAGTARP